MTSPRYQFGDTDVALDRLELLADVFHESTAAFLRRVAGAPPALALDLGSGPGRTTVLVAESTKAERVIGLDSSPVFVAAATARFGDRVEFLQHDVTEAPFPTPQANFIYCRFLLTHLRNPTEAVAQWIAHLSSGGLLVLEELEFIEADAPGFNAYERFVEALLANQGQRLFVGREMVSCCPPRAAMLESGVRHVRVPRRDAATLALMNLSQLRRTEWAAEHYSENWLDELATDLEVFRDSDGKPAVFGLREHVLQRI